MLLHVQYLIEIIKVIAHNEWPSLLFCIINCPSFCYIILFDKMWTIYYEYHNQHQTHEWITIKFITTNHTSPILLWLFITDNFPFVNVKSNIKFPYLQITFFYYFVFFSFFFKIRLTTTMLKIKRFYPFSDTHFVIEIICKGVDFDTECITHRMKPTKYYVPLLFVTTWPSHWDIFIIIFICCIRLSVVNWTTSYRRNSHTNYQ